MLLLATFEPHHTGVIPISVLHRESFLMEKNCISKHLHQRPVFIKNSTFDMFKEGTVLQSFLLSHLITEICEMNFIGLYV